MVPRSGSSSNQQSPLIKEWDKNSKGFPDGLDNLLYEADIEQLFDTLAEWNTYLENHVPYFSERSVTEECGL